MRVLLRLTLSAAIGITAALAAPSAVVAAPTITVTPQGSSGILVEWTGSIAYEIEVKVGSASGTTIQSASGTGTSKAFTGLLAGTTYAVILKQTSDNSTTSKTVTTQFDRPSAPTNLQVNPYCVLSLQATWDPPTDLGSTGVITEYQVSYVVNSVETLVSPTTEEQATLTGFNSPTSLVEVRVAAIDSIGVSPNFASVSKAPNGSASCPTSTDSSGSTNTNPGTGESAGGGGGLNEGEALPGVPKSLSGTDRVATSITVAEADFAPVSTNPTAQSATLRAQAAVIASSVSFADALTAGPLAHSKIAPLFLTGSTSLDARVGSALTKLVPRGAKVYVVGGESAVSPSVVTAITNLGFMVERLAGIDRYETSVKVAQALGNPGKVFAATGLDFPDALAAGVVASRQGGSILLTRGTQIPAVVAGYLMENPTAVVSAVGGPAADAFPTATSYKGVDRYATAVELAKAFPLTSATVGVASGMNFPDGLVAAPYLARRGGTLLLTKQLVIPAVTANYIKATAKIDVLQVFGGLNVVSDSARRTLATYL